MSGVSLHGGLERLLQEAVKVKPGFQWRPQNVGDARVTEYLPGKATSRREYVEDNKAERSWRSEEHFDIRQGDAEFGVYPACF